MTTGQSDTASAIRALSAAFARHFNAADAELLVRDFYAENARLLPPNHPTVTGRSQIRDTLQEFFAAGFGEIAVDAIEIDGAGDVAYAIGTYSLGRPAPDRGKYIEVYRRQTDGSWKCIADMFSSDQPAS